MRFKSNIDKINRSYKISRSSLNFNTKLTSKQGSISIFQIASIAIIISTFALLSSFLIKSKTENNLKRTEILVSESILNTYNDDLYRGFSLLGYKDDRALIKNISIFYEEKYNVNIDVEATKFLSDENIIIQMKAIVLARLGTSYLDDMTKKLEIKDDIVSTISKGKNIVNSMELNLEKYDEFLELANSLVDVFVDISNGYALEELEDEYGLSSIKHKLSRLISLNGSFTSSQGGAVTPSAYMIDSLLSGQLIVAGDNNVSIMESVKKLHSLLSSTPNLEEDISQENEMLFSIAENILVDTYYESNRKNENRNSSDSNDYAAMYKLFKDIHSERSKDIDKSLKLNNVDVDSSYLLLNPIDKLAMIEYMTIMLSDEVVSAKRDHYYTDRKGIVAYENSELEYLITGLDEDESRLKVRNFIRSIRFPLNLMHIYNMESKRATVNSIAVAINTILPIPAFISSPIIAAAWSYLETECDLNTIYEGEAVAFLKLSPDDWATDIDFLKKLGSIGKTISKKEDNKNKKSTNTKINLSKNTPPKKDNSLLDESEVQKLYYNDYLRLMALTKSSSDMMERFKKIVYVYIDEEDFDINELIIEHKIDIYMDKKHNYKFKETLIDGYIN